MNDEHVAELREALARAMQPHLPPQHVAKLADGLAAKAAQVSFTPQGNAHAGTVASALAETFTAMLPEPYRSMASIAESLAPVVAQWWTKERPPVLLGDVTVLDERP